MKQMNLFEIMQNPAIGAIALHSFVLGFYKMSKGRHAENVYPTLRHTFYVLPIAYNAYTLNAINNSNQLYTAIHNNNMFSVNLQDRANSMSEQTFAGLNLAFNKLILTYNKANETVELMEGFASKKIMLNTTTDGGSNNLKKIQDCSYKLGGLFAKTDPKNIQIKLNIRF